MELFTLEKLINTGFTSEEKNSLLLAGPNRQKLSRSLVYELKTTPTDISLFTIVDCRPNYYRVIGAGPKYDIRQLYLLIGDHTEAKFINNFFLSQKHWEKFCNITELGPHITAWRKELRLQIKSKMYDVLISDALDSTSKSCTSSAKYLLEKYYDPKTINNKQTKRSRQEDNALLLEKSSIKEDAKRMGLIN